MRSQLMLACTLLCSSRPVPGQEATPPGGLVLEGAFKSAAHVYLGNADFRGYASYSCDSKRIDLTWNYEVAGLEDGPMPFDRTRWRSRQRIELAYRPTDVVGLADDRLVVAGVTTEQRVVLEVFEFETMPSQALVVAEDREPLVPEVQVPIRSVTRVLDEDALFLGEITYVFPNLGARGHLLFQVAQAGDLYDLEIASGCFARVASTLASGPGILALPHLTETWTDAGSGLHETLGSLYWFHNPGYRSRDSAQGQILLIRDRDSDGVLDDGGLVWEWDETYSLRENWVPRTSRR